MRAPTALAAIAVACVLSGCQAGIFREWDMDGGNSLSVDASQRMVFVTERGGRDANRRVVCAEPSPDGLATMAATFAAQGRGNQVINAAPVPADPAAPAGAAPAAGRPGGTTTIEGAVAAGFATQAALGGIRTQTIQLLRDGLYRACEAYMNGAIDQSQYNILLVNMSQLMTTLVAIDGLTGRPAANTVALSAPAVSAATVELEANCAEKPTEQQKACFEAVAVVKAAASMSTNEGQAPKVAEAEAVKSIVRAAVGHSTFPAMCLSIMSSHRSYEQQDERLRDPGFNQVAAMCRDVFKRLPDRIRYQ